MQRMLGMRDLKPQDLHGMTPDVVTALAAQMLEHIQQQDQLLQHKAGVLAVVSPRGNLAVRPRS